MFFSARSKTTIVAVYDVSSCAVSGAHAILGPGREIQITAQQHSHTPFVTDINAARLLDQSVAALTKTVAAIQKETRHHPEHVQLVLSSPWYFSQTRQIVYKKNTPFVCTRELIDMLITADVQQMRNESPHFGVEGEYRIVDKQISQVLLNGYAVEDPYGKKTQNISFALIVTIAPKQAIERFTAVLERAYGSRSVHIAASPYVSYVALRDSVGVAPDAMVIDIGEEVTDVAFIKNDIFLYQHSFPVGTHGLYRVLAEQGKHTDGEVKAAITSFRLGKLSHTAKRGVEQAIVTFISTWQQGMRTVIDEGQFGLTIPAQCFIVADPLFEQLFVKAITHDVFMQHSVAQGSMEPLFVKQSMVEGLLQHTASGSIDTTIALDVLFIQRLLQYYKK